MLAAAPDFPFAGRLPVATTGLAGAAPIFFAGAEVVPDGLDDTLGLPPIFAGAVLFAGTAAGPAFLVAGAGYVP